MRALRRTLAWAEFDRAVLFGALTPIWGLVASPLTMWLIATRFTPEVQGFYYTFGHLLWLQIFVELGLAQVVIQFASHEWTRLRLDADGRIVGNEDALSRLASLARFSIIWYLVVGATIAAGVGAAGIIFFSRSPQLGIPWKSPWLALCALTGVNLIMTPLWALLEGSNQISAVYESKFYQAVLARAAIWLAIARGAGLWSSAAATLVNILWAAFFFRRYGRYFRSLLNVRPRAHIQWRDEIWPFQWPIAVSWISSLLPLILFTPALFRFQGPAAAGRLGMTWVLVSAVSTISAYWLQTKAARLGMLVSARDYDGLDSLVLRSGTASVGVACAGAFVVETSLVVLRRLRPAFAQRLLPPLPTALFLAATVLMQVYNSQAAYLRAHKKEPFMLLSLGGGALVTLTTLTLAPRYGAIGIGAGYLAVVALLLLPVGTAILSRCRGSWHAPVPSPREGAAA